jgi:hypothetical protein
MEGGSNNNIPKETSFYSVLFKTSTNDYLGSFVFKKNTFPIKQLLSIARAMSGKERIHVKINGEDSLNKESIKKHNVGFELVIYY